MSKQAQNAENNSIAVQSGGDTTLNVGYNPSDLQNLIHCTLTSVMPGLAAVAMATARERLSDFEFRIFERLDALEHKISTATLKEPDFHYILSKAGQSYARSGDPQIGETLVNLIAQRACETGRTRLALSLNDALEKTALLTEDEFSTLSLSYLVRRTIHYSVNSWPTLIASIEARALPFLKDSKTHDASCQYLASQSCGQINEMVAVSFYDIIVPTYAGVCSAGFDKDAILGILPSHLFELADDRSIIIPCLHDATKWQINAINKKYFDGTLSKRFQDDKIASSVWGLHQRAVFPESELMRRMKGENEKISELSVVWNNTALSHFTLTTVGITIAHANARRVVSFDADLGIWIK